MSDPAKSKDDRMLVTLSVKDLCDIVREIVRTELAAANNLQGRGDQDNFKLFFTTKEAADMLSVEETWLAARARAKKVPYKTIGRYRRFSIEDINAIRQSPPTPIPAKKRKLKNFLHKATSH